MYFLKGLVSLIKFPIDFFKKYKLNYTMVLYAI